MSRASRLLVPLFLLFLSACGTFQVQVLDQPATPSALPGDASSARPSGAQCSQLVTDTALPATPDDPRAYIGHHYDELNMPPGLVFNGGGLISGAYYWEWVSRPDFDMQFIQQIDCYRNDGSPYSSVVDAIKIPKPAPGYARADTCSADPAAGPIIVFGKFNESQPEVTLFGVQGWKMFDLDFGQRINVQTMRFEPLSLAGLECVHASGLGS